MSSLLLRVARQGKPNIPRPFCAALWIGLPSAPSQGRWPAFLGGPIRSDGVTQPPAPLSVLTAKQSPRWTGFWSPFNRFGTAAPISTRAACPRALRLPWWPAGNCPWTPCRRAALLNDAKMRLKRCKPCGRGSRPAPRRPSGARVPPPSRSVTPLTLHGPIPAA